MTSSGFPTHDLTSPSTEEDTVAHIISLPNPMDQIWRLLNTALNHSALAVMQEKLLLKQRSSYFYTIQNDNVRALEDQQESTSLPIDMLVSHLGPHRLQRVESWLTSQVVIFLTYLEMLLQEITISRQNLEAFIAKRMQVGVNADEVVSAEQQLKQIQEHMSNFEARMGKIIEPLTLNSLFLLEMRRSLLPSSRLQMSVVDQGPVMFHREKLIISHNSVRLFWYIAGEHSGEPECEFKLLVKTTAPREKIIRKAACISYEYSVPNLKRDTWYKFIVRRMNSPALVYGPWTDTLNLKTLSSRPRTEQHVRGLPMHETKE